MDRPIMLQHDHRHFQRAARKAAKVLIAANNDMKRTIVASIDSGHYEYLSVSNLDELDALSESPSLVIIDGMTPKEEIAAACRRIRLSYPRDAVYIIVIIRGSEQANDYLSTPYAPDDILTVPFTQRDVEARLTVALRIIELENELSARTTDLTRAQNKIKRLNGLLPICFHCKKIRDDRGYWNELEKYISDHSDAEFSHAICPGCLHKYYPDVKDELL